MRNTINIPSVIIVWYILMWYPEKISVWFAGRKKSLFKKTSSSCFVDGNYSKLI